MPMNDSLVRRRGQLIEAEVDDELIGLEVEQGTCFGFNRTATRIWALLETPRRFSELRDVLLGEYEVDRETCERELTDLLRQLEADGLVEMDRADA
jgi:hypothetical protein